jgi:hypothetical protein
VTDVDDTRPIPVTDPVEVREIETPHGPARVRVHPPRYGVARATLVLGHGAGGGTDSADLAALVARLPAEAVEVVLVEQPWRVAGKRVAAAPAVLDEGWLAVLKDLRGSGHGLRRLVVGGRSAGARVACRTVEHAGADAVVCLAFPLHPPGRPARSRVEELVAAAAVAPVVVVQGARDAFGTPDEVAVAAHDAGVSIRTTAVPWADHSFAVPARAPVTRAEALDVVVAAVRPVVLGLDGNAGAAGPR